MDSKDTSKLTCSFCGKNQDDVRKLMLGQVFIFVMNALTYVMTLLMKKLSLKENQS